MLTAIPGILEKTPDARIIIAGGITPDMTAEMCEGAAGWAWGSQTWKGNTPAFEPKPINASMKASIFAVWESPVESNPKLPLWP